MKLLELKSLYDLHPEPEKAPYYKKRFEIPNIAHHEARQRLGQRYLEAEPYVAKNAEQAYLYARDNLKGRFPEGEPAILKDPWATYLYALEVIKGPWPEGEDIMAQEPNSAINYGMYILKHRFLKGEPIIAKHVHHMHMYCGRFNLDNYKFYKKYVHGEKVDL